MQKMISVIVPCFNVAKFLPDFFVCLEKQTYKNFEVVFVDDGSHDDTLRILQNYCASHKNTFVLSQKNAGPSAARNTGVNFSHGEFLSFVDADDMFSKDYLQTLADEIDGFDIAVCGFKWVKETFKPEKAKSHGHGSKVVEGVEKNLCKLLGGQEYTYCVWNKLFRKDIFLKVGGFDEKIFYGEDIDLIFRYFTQIDKVKICKRKTYFYRCRKGGEVRSKFKPKMLTVVQGIDKMIQIAPTEKVEIHARGFKCLSAIEMLFRIYRSDFDDKKAIKKLLADLKENSKACLKASKFPFYKRIGPLAYGILKCLLRKKLKT